MGAADERDGAVGAAAVAALRDFQVGVVLERREWPDGFYRCNRFYRIYIFNSFYLIYHLYHLLPLMHSEPGVHFRHLPGQLFPVAFHQAAADDELLGFECYLFENDVDALLLGVADEAAGVDNDGVAVVPAAVVVYGVPPCLQPSRQILAVDRVLRAAQGDNVDFHLIRYSVSF